MVSHENLFRQHTAHLASSGRYVTFLNRVSGLSGLDITPQTLRKETDIASFIQRLPADTAPKTSSNYRSVLRHYVTMVNHHNL